MSEVRAQPEQATTETIWGLVAQIETVARERFGDFALGASISFKASVAGVGLDPSQWYTHLRQLAYVPCADGSRRPGFLKSVGGYEEIYLLPEDETETGGAVALMAAELRQFLADLSPDRFPDKHWRITAPVWPLPN